MHASKWIAAGLALALLSISAPALAAGPPSGGADRGGFPGLPGPAMFGICKAFGHVDDNATIAPPFQWLSSSICDDAQHPGGGVDEQAAEDEASHDSRRPAHAGPPS